MTVCPSNATTVTTSFLGRPTCLQFMQRHFQCFSLFFFFFSRALLPVAVWSGPGCPSGRRYWHAARSCAVLPPIIGMQVEEMIAAIVHPSQGTGKTVNACCIFCPFILFIVWCATLRHHCVSSWQSFETYAFARHQLLCGMFGWQLYETVQPFLYGYLCMFQCMPILVKVVPC